VYWEHNDHLGTPQALTDVNATVVWTASQTPFGIATVNEDPDGDGIKVRNNFRFPGQYYDAETGLNYNYQRTYDPAIGRYTQSDPIGLNGGMNPYGYVNGNPISNIDPNGLKKNTCNNSNSASNSGCKRKDFTIKLPSKSCLRRCYFQPGYIRYTTCDEGFSLQKSKCICTAVSGIRD